MIIISSKVGCYINIQFMVESRLTSLKVLLGSKDVKPNNKIKIRILIITLHVEIMSSD